MRLTVKIKTAMDGRLDLQVLELPDLAVSAQSVREIPEAVKDAAARLTGSSADYYDVEVGY